MKENDLSSVLKIGRMLEEGGIPHQFTGGAALKIQGVPLADPTVTADVQWDVMEEAYQLFTGFSPSDLVNGPETGSFSFSVEDIIVSITCRYNTTIKTDPYRISIEMDGCTIWCRSLYSHIYDQEMKPFSKAIHAYLSAEQNSFTEENEQAWNQNNYTALLHRYGSPNELAVKIKANPRWRLAPFYKYMGSLEGKKVTHLMGSNGVKAAAMALLGAQVHVADFSRENAAFAAELAEAAGIKMEYTVADILTLPELSDSDLVLMELGVLHYLVDLKPLMEKVRELLKPGGRFILHEFHPVSTKLISSTGKKHKASGNYFEPAIEKTEVAFTKHMPEEDKQKLVKAVQRKWTLGEVITAAGEAGLVIKVLEEEPNHKIHDIGIPKTYTLVADKLE